MVEERLPSALISFRVMVMGVVLTPNSFREAESILCRGSASTMLVEYVYWRMAAAARGSMRSSHGFSPHHTPLGLRRNSAMSPPQLMRIQEISFISSLV